MYHVKPPSVEQENKKNVLNPIKQIEHDNQRIEHSTVYLHTHNARTPRSVQQLIIPTNVTNTRTPAHLH